MLGFFKKNEFIIDESMRKWIDTAFLWLIDSFTEDFIKAHKVLIPHYSDFPIAYDGQIESVIKTLQIVATHMKLSPDDIHLDLYSEGQTEISTGGQGRFFLKQVDGDKYSSGLYWGKQPDGKYHIGIESDKLKDPEKIVAVLAHEIAHIKLLCEGKIDENIEPLTDLTTIIFGLGIFNANAAFKFEQGNDYWAYSKTGYLSQMEWAYALALYAHIRDEKTPYWIEHLTKNIKSDFKKSTRFIVENLDKVLQFNDENKGGC
jgi:hypothetical protein